MSNYKITQSSEIYPRSEVFIGVYGGEIKRSGNVG